MKIEFRSMHLLVVCCCIILSSANAIRTLKFVLAIKETNSFDLFLASLEAVPLYSLTAHESALP